MTIHHMQKRLNNYFIYLIQNHDELFCYLTEDIIFIFLHTK